MPRMETSGSPSSSEPVQELDIEALVDRVTERTKGTAGDPLSRAEVEQVVRMTLVELGGDGVLVLER